MIADVQMLDIVSRPTEVPGQFNVVQDLDLIYVGGGSETGMLF